MPTFREELHLGRKVPTTDTADIVDRAITEPKLADDAVSTRTIQDGAVTMEKLSEDVQELVRCPWTPMGYYDSTVTYDGNDVVYDPETNASYLSLHSGNTGHAVTDDSWWMKLVEIPEASIEAIVEDKIKIPVTKQVSPQPGFSYLLRPRVKTLFGETSTLKVQIKHPGTPYGPVAGVLNEYLFAFTTPFFPAMTLEVSTGDYPIVWTSEVETEAHTHYEVRIVYDEMQEMYFGKIESWAFPGDNIQG